MAYFHFVLDAGYTLNISPTPLGLLPVKIGRDENRVLFAPFGAESSEKLSGWGLPSSTAPSAHFGVWVGVWVKARMHWFAPLCEKWVEREHAHHLMGYPSQMYSESSDHIYITKNGYGDMVIMSYESIRGKVVAAGCLRKIGGSRDRASGRKDSGCQQRVERVEGKAWTIIS